MSLLFLCNYLLGRLRILIPMFLRVMSLEFYTALAYKVAAIIIEIQRKFLYILCSKLPNFKLTRCLVPRYPLGFLRLGDESDGLGLGYSVIAKE